MRRFLQPVLVITGLWFSFSSEAASRDASVNRPRTHEDSLIEAFADWCRAGLSYDNIAARARLEHLRPEADPPLTLPNGGRFRQTIWTGELPTGRFTLQLKELNAPAASYVSCAITGRVQNVEAFVDELIRQLRLAVQPRLTSISGRRAYFFQERKDGSGLFVEDLTTAGQTFVSITAASARM